MVFGSMVRSDYYQVCITIPPRDSIILASSHGGCIGRLGLLPRHGKPTARKVISDSLAHNVNDLLHLCRRRRLRPARFLRPSVPFGVAEHKPGRYLTHGWLGGWIGKYSSRA